MSNRFRTLCQCTALVAIAQIAGVSADSTEPDHAVSTHDTGSIVNDVVPEIGMSMDAVRQLLHQNLARDEIIGGACGMLEVMTNKDESIRVIGFGGVVTSVSHTPRGASTAAKNTEISTAIGTRSKD